MSDLPSCSFWIMYFTCCTETTNYILLGLGAGLLRTRVNPNIRMLTLRRLLSLSSAFPFKTGYVKSIPSTEHHKIGYWWRHRGVWVVASVFLKTIRCALPIYTTIYTTNILYGWFHMKTSKIGCGHLADFDVNRLIRFLLLKKNIPPKDFFFQWRV